MEASAGRCSRSSSPALLTSSTVQGAGLSPPRGSPGDLGQPRHCQQMTNAPFRGGKGLSCAAQQVRSPGVPQHLQQHLHCTPRSSSGAASLSSCTDCATRMFTRCPWVRGGATTPDSVNSLQGSAVPRLSLKPCPGPETPSDSAARSYRACSGTAGSSGALLAVGTAGRPCWADRQADKQRSRPLAGLYSSGMCRQCLTRS